MALFDGAIAFVEDSIDSANLAYCSRFGFEAIPESQRGRVMQNLSMHDDGNILQWP